MAAQGNMASNSGASPRLASQFQFKARPTAKAMMARTTWTNRSPSGGLLSADE